MGFSEVLETDIETRYAVEYAASFCALAELRSAVTHTALVSRDLFLGSGVTVWARCSTHVNILSGWIGCAYIQDAGRFQGYPAFRLVKTLRIFTLIYKGAAKVSGPLLRFPLRQLYKLQSSCLMTACGGQAKRDLEGIVDEPLECRLVKLVRLWRQLRLGLTIPMSQSSQS